MIGILRMLIPAYATSPWMTSSSPVSRFLAYTPTIPLRSSVIQPIICSSSEMSGGGGSAPLSTTRVTSRSEAEFSAATIGGREASMSSSRAGCPGLKVSVSALAWGASMPRSCSLLTSCKNWRSLSSLNLPSAGITTGGGSSPSKNVPNPLSKDISARRRASSAHTVLCCRRNSTRGGWRLIVSSSYLKITGESNACSTTLLACSSVRCPTSSPAIIVPGEIKVRYDV